MKKMTWKEFSGAYCERQEQTPDKLLAILKTQQIDYEPDGFMLLECQALDSSLIGSYTILPYGPNNTYKTIPNRPISPRGLASDMSIAVGYFDAKDLLEN